MQYVVTLFFYFLFFLAAKYLNPRLEILALFTKPNLSKTSILLIGWIPYPRKWGDT